jgi:hypothetical protein
MLRVGHVPHPVMKFEPDVFEMVKDHEFVVGNGIKMMFCVLLIS